MALQTPVGKASRAESEEKRGPRMTNPNLLPAASASFKKPGAESSLAATMMKWISELAAKQPEKTKEIMFDLMAALTGKEPEMAGPPMGPPLPPPPPMGPGGPPMGPPPNLPPMGPPSGMPPGPPMGPPPPMMG
jgi:hypothetical protein